MYFIIANIAHIILSACNSLGGPEYLLVYLLFEQKCRGKMADSHIIISYHIQDLYSSLGPPRRLTD